MQVFVCYPEPLKVAQAMWKDSKRYNKQCLEVVQIIRAIPTIRGVWNKRRKLLLCIGTDCKIHKW